MILSIRPRLPLFWPVTDDGDLSGAKNFFLEHEQWWVNPPLLVPPPPPQAILADEDVLANAKNFWRDEDFWFPPVIWPFVPPFPVCLDDEVLPGATNFFLEHEAWWINPPLLFPLPPQQALVDDEVLNFTGIDEDYWWTARWQTIPFPPVQAITDDEVLALLFLDEDFWWVPSYHGYTIPLQAITDDEVLPGAKNFALDEDLYLSTLTFSQSLVRQAILDTDEVAPRIVEDDGWLSLAPILLTWRICLPWTETDELPLLGYEDQDTWTAQRQSLYPLPAPAVTDDDIPALLGFEEDSWSTPVLTSSSSLLWPIWDAEFSSSGLRFRLIDTFLVRCAKTCPVTVRGAKTKPQTVIC